MRLAIAAARSAPGVTTSALALASVWPGRMLLVEACEDGGSLAARYGLALEPGLTTLAAALRNGGSATAMAHAQALPGTDERIRVLLAPPATEPAQVLWRTAADGITHTLRTVPDVTAVLVDAGRLPATPACAAVLAASDRLLLVARPRLEDLQTLAHRLPILRGLGPPIELLLVGSQPYGADEIAATLGCPVAGVLADDPRAAAALAGLGPARRLDRSALLRSAVPIVEQLASPTDQGGGVAASSERSPARPFTAARP